MVPSLSLPVSELTSTGNGSPSDPAAGDRSQSGAQAALTVRYTRGSGWFAFATLRAYLEPATRNPWDGDFVYSFGYDDWHPDTFSLTYSNYGNNRFSPAAGEPVTNLSRGVISAGYKFRVPPRLAEPLLIDRSQDIGCRLNLNYVRRYERVTGSDGRDKLWAGFGCRYPIVSRAFFDFAAFVYLKGEKRPWDPDFTYSFGWFDWRPGRLSLQYSNYAGNRLPWNKGTGTGGFRRGSIALTYNYAF